MPGGRRALLLAGLTTAALVAVLPADRTDPGTASPGPLGSLLTLVPNTAANRSFVLLNDYAAARAAGDVSLPANATDAASYRDVMTVRTAPGLATVPSQLSGGRGGSDDEWRTSAGYAFPDVDADVVAGSGSEETEAVIGRMTAARVGAAVRADADWAGLLRTDGHRGSTVFSWGESGEVLTDRADGLHPDGSGGYVGVTGTSPTTARVSRAGWRGGVDSMIDAAAGRARSLATEPVFRALTEALDAAGAHAAFLTTDVAPYAVPAERADRDERVANEPTVARYDAFATGIGRDASGPYVVVALAYRDEDRALANATRLRTVVDEGWSFGGSRPWSDLLRVGSVDVTGNVVVARLATALPVLWFDVVVDHDSLLWWS